jgi:uncharacterized membrane protein
MPNVPAAQLARAGLIGAASGSRGMLGVAALAVSAGRRTPGAPITTAALVVAAVGELVADKLPNIPSRLTPPIFAGRLVSGALGGAILCYRQQRDPVAVTAAAVVGAAAGAAAAWGGVNWRRFATSTFGGDLPGALVEDAAAIGLARAAVAR